MDRLGIERIDLTVDAEGQVRLSAPLPAGAAAAIGSFDGVHRGHVRVIEQALSRAAGGPAMAVLFDPHPHAFFRPADPPFRLTSLQQQLVLFESLSLSHAVCIRFDGHLAAMSPTDFATRVLKETLGLAFISCGFDFNFGARGAGKANDLVEFGRKLGFDVAVLPCQTDDDGHKLSSSAVRAALKDGDCARAAAVLGRPQTYRAEVIHGAKMGRTIGIPTLNMELGDYQRPAYGVYVTRTRLPDGSRIEGVSNIGIRPMVGGDIELLETFLFDWSGDLYGQTVETELLDFIRPEGKFESWEAMKAEIDRDIARARAFIRRD